MKGLEVIENILVPFCGLTGDLKWKGAGRPGQSETIDVIEDNSPSRAKYRRIDRPKMRSVSKWDLETLKKTGKTIEKEQIDREKAHKLALKLYDAAEKTKVREVNWLQNAPRIVRLKPSGTARSGQIHAILFRDNSEDEVEYAAMVSDLPKIWENSSFSDGFMVSEVHFKYFRGHYFIDVLALDG